MQRGGGWQASIGTAKRHMQVYKRYIGCIGWHWIGWVVGNTWHLSWAQISMTMVGEF